MIWGSSFGRGTVLGARNKIEEQDMRLLTWSFCVKGHEYFCMLMYDLCIILHK